MDLPAVREAWVVKLDDEAGVRNRLVLLVHGVGDGVEELLLVVVVVVAQPVLNGAGGQGRDEALIDVVGGHAGLEVLHVAGGVGLALVGERANGVDGAGGEGTSAGLVEAVEVVLEEGLLAGGN